jgi:acetyl-CoA carboxylase biotin carboxyl carrier protein
VSTFIDYLNENLPALLEVLQSSDVCDLDLREGPFSLHIRRSPILEPAGISNDDLESPDGTPAAPSAAQIVSPLVGTFFRSGESGGQPFVSEGSRVDRETVVGIVDALQHATEVEAGYAGVITSALVGDGEPVEYGQGLFEMSLGD